MVSRLRDSLPAQRDHGTLAAARYHAQRMCQHGGSSLGWRLRSEVWSALEISLMFLSLSLLCCISLRLYLSCETRSPSLAYDRPLRAMKSLLFTRTRSYFAFATRCVASSHPKSLDFGHKPSLHPRSEFLYLDSSPTRTQVIPALISVLPRLASTSPNR